MRLPDFAKNLIAGAVNLVLPPECVHCRRDIAAGEIICAECFNKIRVYDAFFCGKCRARLPAAASLRPPKLAAKEEAGAGLPFPRKTCHADFPFILGAASDYDGAAKDLVHALKFGKLRLAAEPLGKILVDYAAKTGVDFSDFLVAPVPLHSSRLRERGFNQAELLAKIFAEHFHLSLDVRLLRRQRKTKAQSELKNFTERAANVADCFVVANAETAHGTTSPDGYAVHGKNIILIDDVVTSGSTLLAAANALKQAGARKILALTAARAT